MRVVVVVPTYQEADNIVTAVTQTRASVPDADVLVVDDSSPDGTADLVRRLDDPHVHLLVRPERGGFGPAYRAGWAWALERGYDVVVSMDADGSHDPAALPELLTAVGAGADLAIGSRYVPGGSIPGWSLRRRLLSRGGNVYAGALLGLHVADATAGYRAYRAGLLRRLDLATLGANGYAFQIELAYRTAEAGGRIVEVPITFADRTLGTSKMSGSIIREALALVTWWAVRDRVLHRHPTAMAPTRPAPPTTRSTP